MNLDLTSNENDQTSSVEKLESNSIVDSQPTIDASKSLADAAFAQLDATALSIFAPLRRAFEEAESKLAVANAKRDETWSLLPEETQKSLADASRRDPRGTTKTFVKFKPEELPYQTFDAAVRARSSQLQARKIFYRRRDECLIPLIDRFLLSCDGSSSLEAVFPADEFKTKAQLLKDLRFCESIDGVMKTAEKRWKESRPCVVADSLREFATCETRREKRRHFREIKREMINEYATSPEWKKSASSLLTIAVSLTVSTICVVLLWAAILRWDLVYLLRYERLFPYKSDAYRFLLYMTPVLWIALALVYRNFVLFRLQFRSVFKKFKQDVAEAADALK